MRTQLEVSTINPMRLSPCPQPAHGVMAHFILPDPCIQVPKDIVETDFSVINAKFAKNIRQ